MSTFRTHPHEACMTDSDLERIARRRVAARMGWMIHAAVYVTVNLMLALIAVSAGRAWNVYPLLGWGLGLAIHGAVVWLALPGGGLYQRLLDRERDRLRGVTSPR